MVWREILNAGDRPQDDPAHEDEIYDVPVVIGSDLISQAVDYFHELNGMIEIRLQARVQFWRAMYATAALVIEMDEGIREAGEKKIYYKYFTIHIISQI